MFFCSKLFAIMMVVFSVCSCFAAENISVQGEADPHALVIPFKGFGISSSPLTARDLSRLGADESIGLRVTGFHKDFVGTDNPILMGDHVVACEGQIISVSKAQAVLQQFDDGHVVRVLIYRDKEWAEATVRLMTYDIYFEKFHDSKDSIGRYEEIQERRIAKRFQGPDTARKVKNFGFSMRPLTLAELQEQSNLVDGGFVVMEIRSDQAAESGFATGRYCNAVQW